MRFFRKKLLIFSLAAALLAPLVASAYTPSSSELYGSVLRLHILANSDSAEDQRVKLLVRDALLEYEAQHMSLASDKAAARQALMADGAALLRVAEEALAQNGASYGAQLCIGTFAFPARSYGGATYPAGDYEALRIILGDGAGKNWWCVMFPPLCILELPDGEIDVEGLKLDSLLLKRIKEADGGKLWKKITELLQISSR